MNTPATRIGSLDPMAQKILDDILALMQAQNLPSVTAYGTADGTGVTTGLTATDMDGRRWQYSYYAPGDRLALAPTSASLGPGEMQQFTATATDGTGQPIAGAAFTWTVTGIGTIDAAGLYTAPASVAAASMDTVRCALQGSAAWAVVTVALHP